MKGEGIVIIVQRTFYTIDRLHETFMNIEHAEIGEDNVTPIVYQ